MKSNLAHATLACCALALTSTAAFATVTPIIATPVILEHDPAGIVARGTTDADGNVTFRDLAPGKYVLTIDGPGLVAAMDRLALPAPAKSGGMGIGGGLFGGSRHSSSGGQGAGPAQTSQGSSHSSGVSAGIDPVHISQAQEHLSVPAGGGDKNSNPSTISASIYDWNLGSQRGNLIASGVMQYSRDAASKGMRIGFIVPEGGSSNVELGIQAVPIAVSAKQ
jgi:hypothetical protein